jgi:hypothetical protein
LDQVVKRMAMQERTHYTAIAASFKPIIGIIIMDEIYGIHVVRASLAVNAKVATALGSIPASSGTVEYEKQQMKQR